MIEVANLYKSLSGNGILHGLSFTVPSGQITGLVGPNGSGKTTAIRVMTGYYEADAGCVRIGGHVMSLRARRAKRLIGYAPENAPAYRDQTGYEYLHYMAELRGLSGKIGRAEVERVSTLFSLHEVIHQRIGTLSKGFRHRLTLAQSLLGDPPVLILDEPTDGLDPWQKNETRKLIRSLADSKTVLLTTHLLEEVESLCDRVVVLKSGKVVSIGRLQEIRDMVRTGKEGATLVTVAQAAGSERELPAQHPTG